MNRWALLPLFLTQGLWAAQRTPRLPPAPGRTSGASGQGTPLSLLALGDSIVAGVGVTRSEDALPAQLAQALARKGGYAVRWRALGLNGAQSPWVWTEGEALAAGGETPDLVVISNGINDVTTFRSERDVQERLRAVILRLEQCFPDALVGQLGLPPLGAFPALPQPLRSALGQRSDRIDGQFRGWLAEREAAHYLPFEAMPRPEQFARDGYHPAADAVALWAESVAVQLTPLLAARHHDRMSGDT